MSELHFECAHCPAAEPWQCLAADCPHRSGPRVKRIEKCYQRLAKHLGGHHYAGALDDLRDLFHSALEPFDYPAQVGDAALHTPPPVATAAVVDAGEVERVINDVDRRLKRYFGSCGDTGVRQDVEDIIRRLAATPTPTAGER